MNILKCVISRLHDLRKGAYLSSLERIPGLQFVSQLHAVNQRLISKFSHDILCFLNDTGLLAIMSLQLKAF